MLQSYDIALDIPGVASRNPPLFKALRDGIIRRATWVQEGAVDGSKTLAIYGGTVAAERVLVSFGEIAGLGALGGKEGAVQPISPLPGVLQRYAHIQAGEAIILRYLVNTAGVVGPGACTVHLDVEEVGDGPIGPEITGEPWHLFTLDLPGNANRTVPLWKATAPGRIDSGTFMIEAGVDGTKTATVRNLTQGKDLTSALNMVVGASQGADFVPVADPTYKEGDIIGLVYAATGAVAPGQVSVLLVCAEGAVPGYGTGEIGG